MRSAGMAMAIPAFAGCTTSTRTNPSPTGVTLPTELDRTHKAKANKLQSLSGDAFDRAYLA